MPFTKYGSPELESPEKAVIDSKQPVKEEDEVVTNADDKPTDGVVRGDETAE